MDAVKILSQIFLLRFIPITGQAILSTAFLLLCTMPSLSQTGLIGKWADADHNEKKVEMYMGSDNKIYGSSEKGLTVFQALMFDTITHNYKGILINPDGKQVFEIAIRQPTANEFTFVVKKLFFTKTFVFKRLTGNK